MASEEALRAAAEAVVAAWVDDESGMETFDPTLIDALADALATSPTPSEGLRSAAQDIITSFARRPGWVLEHDSEEADALRAALLEAPSEGLDGE